MPDAPALPVLPTELSIYTAAETCSTWLSWLSNETAALDGLAELAPVDASQIDCIDGAGMQLLLSLARTIRERGLELHLSNPSQALQDACAALGTSTLLDGEVCA